MAKKIAFAAYRSTHGGSIRMSVWLSNSLAKYYEVTYINFSNMAVYYPLSDDVRLVEYKQERLAEKYSKLYELLRKEKFDIVINFGDRLVYFLAIFRGVLNYKLIVSQRDIIADSGIIKRKLKYGGAYGRADCIVAQTKDILNSIESFSTKKLRKVVIANPYIKTDKRWYGGKGKHILCAARVYIDKKRQDLLIEAMANIVKKYPDSELDFYGADVDGNVGVLNKLIKKYGLERSVHYRGVAKDISEIMAKYDLLVLASDYEGIPNVLIEGLGMEIPIIATDCAGGGAKFLLGNNERGLLVKRGSALALESAIIECFNDRDATARRAQNGKVFVLKVLSEENVILKWRSVIENIDA